MKYTQEIVNAAVEKALAAAKVAAHEFAERHPEDFGTCGFAHAEAPGIGRKTKLKNMLENAGVRLGTRYGWSKKLPGCNLYVTMPHVPGYCQQAIDYEEARYRAFANVIAEELKIECYMCSRVD